MFDPDYELDPTYSNSLKETKIILLIFAVWAAYTLTVAYQFGYPPPRPSGDATVPEVATVLGMPAWIFWAIVVPWLAANFITAWFCFAYFSDDELNEAEEAQKDQHSTDEAKING